MTAKPQPESTPEAVKAKRSLLRRSKRSEREFARWLQVHDGPDEKYKHLTSSTGRIGFINQLRADAVSKKYLAEAKNVKVTATLGGWWQLICTQALDWKKEPILMWEPSNADEYKVAGKKLPSMHILTADRHAELLDKEKWFDAQYEDRKP